MSITTTETRKKFHVKPVEKCSRNPTDLFGWPSGDGERFLIQQTHEAGSAFYSREAIQTIVEAMQAWLDETQREEPLADWERELSDYEDDREEAKAAHPSSQPAPAFAEGDRVRITGEDGRFGHVLRTGAEGVVGRVDLSDDSALVETDDDFQWVGFEQLEKVDAYSDEEREANGRLAFVNLGDYYDGDRLGIPSEALAAFGEERAESSDGNYIQTIYDPADFKPIEPTLPFGDDVIKAGDKVKIRTTKASGDPRWIKVSESDWLEVKVNTRNELHADGRILAHANVTILEHYPAAEREANDKLVFVAGYTVISWADVPHSYDSVPAGGVNWYPVNLDPSDFHPVPEPEPLKVGDRVRLVNLKEPYWTCHGADEFTGRTGVVLELLDDGHFDTRVQVDGDGLSFRGLAFSELERV